jgi:hypothetical protein
MSPCRAARSRTTAHAGYGSTEGVHVYDVDDDQQAPDALTGLLPEALLSEVGAWAAQGVCGCAVTRAGSVVPPPPPPHTHT